MVYSQWLIVKRLEPCFALGEEILTLRKDNSTAPKACISHVTVDLVDDDMGIATGNADLFQGEYATGQH